MATNNDELPRQLPICILTGFLGAGKTTLLNRILKSEHASRTGVIINDFGEIDIDSQLIEAVTGDAVSLRNGCICCTMREDFLEAVCRLVGRAEPPERLIVETSGVSDPSSIIDTLTHPDLARVLRVDSVVTVVDASEFLTLRPDERRLADAQIAAADLVVVNKAGLAEEKTLATVDERVRSIVPDARLFHTNHGDVPWSLLFAEDQAPTQPATMSTTMNGGRPAVGEADRPVVTVDTSFKLTVFRRKRIRGGALPHRCDHSCRCVDHQHHEATAASQPALTEAFESASVIIERPLAMDKLHEVLRTLPRDIYRLKGLFHVDVTPERQLVVQVVGDRISAVDLLTWGQKPRRSEVVAIGIKGQVSSGELRRLFEACAVATERPRAAGLAARLTSWFRD